MINESDIFVATILILNQVKYCSHSLSIHFAVCQDLSRDLFTQVPGDRRSCKVETEDQTTSSSETVIETSWTQNLIEQKFILF